MILSANTNIKQLSGQKSYRDFREKGPWPLKSTLAFRPGVGRNYVIITYIRTPTKRFLKIHFKFAYYPRFLIHLEWKRQICSYTPVFPQKRYPNSDKNRQNLHPFSDQNGAKTTPFGAAHTFKAYIMEYFPPPPPHTHTRDQIIFSFRRRSFANSREGLWSIFNKSLIDKHVLEHRYSYKRALSNNP